MDAPQEKLPGLTEAEQELLKKVFSSPLDIPAEWKAWLVSYLEANPPEIPFTQLFGYENFVSTQVSVVTSSGTNSASHTFGGGDPEVDVTGPSLGTLEAGKYILLATFNSSATVIDASHNELVVDNGGPTVKAPQVGGITVSGFALVTFSVPTVVGSTLKMAVGGSGSAFSIGLTNASILAIRYDHN